MPTRISGFDQFNHRSCLVEYNPEKLQKFDQTQFGIARFERRDLQMASFKPKSKHFESEHVQGYHVRMRETFDRNEEASCFSLDY